MIQMARDDLARSEAWVAEQEEKLAAAESALNADFQKMLGD